MLVLKTIMPNSKQKLYGTFIKPSPTNSYINYQCGLYNRKKALNDKQKTVWYLYKTKPLKQLHILPMWPIIEKKALAYFFRKCTFWCHVLLYHNWNLKTNICFTENKYFLYWKQIFALLKKYSLLNTSTVNTSTGFRR